MTTNTATVPSTAAQPSRNGLKSQYPPIWLGIVVALAGAMIATIAVKADYGWVGDDYRFAFKPASLMWESGGLVLFVGGLTTLLPLGWRRLGEWLLVILAAVTVALAADIDLQPQRQVSPRINQASRAGHQRARRVLFLKAAQEQAQHDASSKFAMILLLGGAVGLVRWSAPVRQQRDPNLQSRALAADIPSVTGFLGLEFQLGLLAVLIQQFNLVSPLFGHHIVPLIFFGFLIHYFLPFEYRLPFFLLLSFTAIILVFGFVQASWLVAVGLTLIGICHLPVPFLLRVALVVLAGFALGELRVGWFHAPWSEAIWPILASMFMFRLIVYLYSLNHRKAPPGFWSSLSYFFLLPNVVFPLFPVVDYATFYRNYYDADRHLIHQRGLKWMFWGVIHLLLYRYIYYYMVIGPDDVNSVTNLARYLVSNFLLILRLSGQFHLVIGILLLFGFDLPRIMNRYWHADSFSDFWRRANIYWRDFMQRVVFYPIYFRLRHWPATASLLLATVVVFLITWALHGYQWFWLRGSFSLSGPDVLFWTLFGALVAANTVYDAKTAARKKAKAHQAGFRRIAVHTLRIMGVFSVICLLWSIWISTSLSEWVSLWDVPAPTWKDVTVLVPAFLAGVALAAWGAIVAQKEELGGLGPAVGTPAGAREKSFLAAAWPTAAAMLVLLLISQPAVYGRFGPGFTALADEMSKEKLSRQDLATLERGYYENLTRVDRFNSQLWEKYNKGHDDKEEAQEELQGRADWRANYVQTADFLGLVLRPSVGKPGGPFYTNRWGMRDKDYEKKPPAGTLRIALVGGSPEMNREVPNDKLWEALLEDRLNRENDHKTFNQVEILNFAAATHTTIHRLAMFEEKVLPFQPDILFYVAHPSDRNKANNRLAEIVVTGASIPYDYLRQIVKKSGAKQDMELREIRARLKPYSNEVVAWCYKQIVQTCHERNIVPVFIYLPNLRALGEEETPDHLRFAADAGFNVLNLNGIFDGMDDRLLHKNDWDFHPNAKGHAIIAEKIYEALHQNPAVLGKKASVLAKAQ